MYEEFYGFVQSPFTLAPDPRFLYLSGSHDEAIRLLLQSLRRKEGFIVLTGDIGTGKTTLCRALLEQLDQTTFTSLVLNPFLSVDQLLREILLDFGVVSRDAVRSGRVAGASKHELLSTLNDFLLSLVPIRGSGVLIIDEAQHLSPQVLEEIRVVSTLETNNEKLLQIVLVGQLSLLDVLAAADMRQLNQRVSLKAMLKPLSREEVDAYVAHRLSVAKGSSSVSFDSGAVDTIHAISSGVPRVINLICDRALMLGAQVGASVITADFIREAARALSLKPPRAARWWQRIPRWMAATAAFLVLTGTALALAPLDRIVDAGTPPPPGAPRTPGAPSIRPADVPTDIVQHWNGTIRPLPQPPRLDVRPNRLGEGL
jgi:general secretion pathway protein A